MRVITRASVSINERQLQKLKDLTARLKISQTDFIGACIDVMDDHEVLSILSRYQGIKRADRAAKLQAQADALKVP